MERITKEIIEEYTGVSCENINQSFIDERNENYHGSARIHDLVNFITKYIRSEQRREMLPELIRRVNASNEYQESLLFEIKNRRLYNYIGDVVRYIQSDISVNLCHMFENDNEFDETVIDDSHSDRDHRRRILNKLVRREY